MKRILSTLNILLGVVSLLAQKPNMYDYENFLFQNQLYEFRTKKSFGVYNMDFYFGDETNVGGVFLFQLYGSFQFENESLFGGYNLCVQQFNWSKPQDNMGYVNRAYFGYGYTSKFGSFSGGLYAIYATHSAFEYLQYPISWGYVNYDYERLKLRPFFQYNLNIPRVSLNFRTQLREYLFTKAEYKYKIGNYQLYHGLLYQQNIRDLGLSTQEINKLAIVSKIDGSSITVDMAISTFFDKQDKIMSALEHVAQNPAKNLTYMAEFTIDFLLLGLCYDDFHKLGGSVGYKEKQPDGGYAYFIFKYNDGFKDPLLRGIRNIFSFAFKINVDFKR